MNSQHRAIRAIITSMSRRRATEYIQSFKLLPDEEICLIERDVNGLSYTQIMDKHHMSPEVIKRRRQMAYRKIADDINNK